MNNFVEQINNGFFFQGLLTDNQNNQLPVTITATPDNSQNPSGDRQYYNSIIQQQQAGNIESNCASVFFWNNAPTTGGAVLNVNGMTFNPGQFISLPGQMNEKDTTRYQISFTGGGIQSAVIIRKIYL